MENYLNGLGPNALLTRMIKEGSFGTWFIFEPYSVLAFIVTCAGFGVSNKTTIFNTFLIVISALEGSEIMIKH